MTARKRVLVPALIVAFALAACGGDDEGDTSERTQPSPGGPVATVNVSETDFRIDPSNPRIAKSGLVRFEVRNEGEVEHSLEIEGPTGESRLARTLAPGESGTLDVNLEPGRYEWYCPVGNHREMGMRGEMRVAGGDAPPSSEGSGGGGGDDSGGGSGDGSSGDSSGGYDY